MKRLLVKALKNKFDMAKEDAIALAKTVEGIFNGREEIEDMSFFCLNLGKFEKTTEFSSIYNIKIKDIIILESGSIFKKKQL